MTAFAVRAAVTDGYVVRVDAERVYLDWGTASNVKKGDRFQVYRAGIPLKHPVTGALLGHTEEKLGTGTLETIEPKFSIGRLDPAPGAVKAGDRVRHLIVRKSVIMSSEPVTTEEAAPAATEVSPKSPGLAEIWRSEPLDKDAAALTFADVDGDGLKEIVVAYRNKIQAYRWKDKKLESLGSYDHASYRHWVAVDGADLKREGREEIFATTYQDALSRPRVIVLRYEHGGLKEVGTIEGFVRAVQRKDGSRPLYWQTLSRSRDLHYTAVSELRWEKGSYRTGRPLDLKLFREQLFGLAWGDWTKTGSENFAMLDQGDRLRVFAPDMKWRSNENYGGTKNTFIYENNHVGQVTPRLIAWRPADGDRDQLLVSTNFPELGIRMTHLKIYKRSQLAGLHWNGLEMTPAWRVPISGYLADFGIADAMGTSRPQLWIATVGPGDKTILLSYTLP